MYQSVLCLAMFICSIVCGLMGKLEELGVCMRNECMFVRVMCVCVCVCTNMCSCFVCVYVLSVCVQVCHVSVLCVCKGTCASVCNIMLCWHERHCGCIMLRLLVCACVWWHKRVWYGSMALAV